MPASGTTGISGTVLDWVYFGVIEAYVVNLQYEFKAIITGSIYLYLIINFYPERRFPILRFIMSGEFGLKSE